MRFRPALVLPALVLVAALSACGSDGGSAPSDAAVAPSVPATSAASAEDTDTAVRAGCGMVFRDRGADPSVAAVLPGAVTAATSAEATDDDLAQIAALEASLETARMLGAASSDFTAALDAVIAPLDEIADAADGATPTADADSLTTSLASLADVCADAGFEAAK